MNLFWNLVEDQNKVKNELNKICTSRRVPHAFIFSGPRGVGKFNSAINFAKVLSKEIYSSPDSIIKKIDNLQEPYIRLIFPLPRGKNETPEDSDIDKLSKDVIEEIQNQIAEKVKNPYHEIILENANQIKVSSIRELKRFVSINIIESGLSTIIINDAHLMNDQAQNALLKTLEEPPENTLIILLTSNKDLLLSTVKSRARIIEFAPLSNSGVSRVLQHNYKIDPITADQISLFAEGSVLKAYELIAHNFNGLLETTINILRYTISRKYQQSLSELINFTSNNSDESLILLIYMIKIWLLDVLKDRNSIKINELENYSDTIKKFNQRYKNLDILKPIKNLEKLEFLLGRKMNLNVFYLNLIFELSSIVKRI